MNNQQTNLRELLPVYEWRTDGSGPRLHKLEGNEPATGSLWVRTEDLSVLLFKLARHEDQQRAGIERGNDAGERIRTALETPAARHVPDDRWIKHSDETEECPRCDGRTQQGVNGPVFVHIAPCTGIAQNVCPHGIQWPHECKECADAVVVPDGWCPICGGQDGEHKPGCRDGSEVL